MPRVIHHHSGNVLFPSAGSGREKNAPLPDDGLIRDMQTGDEAALGAAIEKYTAYVGTIVWNIVNGSLNEADAKEIVSGVFFSLWKNCSKVRPGKLKAYLGSIARSKALDALRHAKRDVSLDDDFVEVSIPGPENDAVKAEEYAALRNAVERLPEPDHTIFIRHYYYYQKTGEIAETMGLNVNTVQSKLRRGREILRRELEKGGCFIG